MTLTGLRNRIINALGWVIAPVSARLQFAAISELHGKDVLVLGSAPTPALPANAKDMLVICCNGSGANTSRLGLRNPTITVVDNELIDKDVAFSKDVRSDIIKGKVLSGLNLGILVATQSNTSRGGSPELLGGNFDKFLKIRKYTRRNILDEVTGTNLLERDNRVSLCSTGGFAVALSVYLGAKSVTISGFTHLINPNQMHFYDPVSESNIKVLNSRNHSLADSALITLAVINGHKIFTSEADLLPLVQNWGNQGPGW